MNHVVVTAVTIVFLKVCMKHRTNLSPASVQLRSMHILSPIFRCILTDLVFPVFNLLALKNYLLTNARFILFQLP